MQPRTQTDLLTLAGQYFNQRKVPASVSVASQLASPILADKFLHRSKEVGMTVLSADLELRKESQS